MPHKTTTSSSGAVVATAAILDRWSTHDWRDGMSIADLQPLDRVTVRTLNSTYEIVVVAPDSADVAVRGGTFFPTFSRAHVAGSSLGGSFLKVHSIHVGFCLELVLNARSIVTSPVQSISVGRSDTVM
ncbi:MAG: hypothetical protein ABJA98_05480 [Acidobacteriota bacterium]